MQASPSGVPACLHCRRRSTGRSVAGADRDHRTYAAAGRESRRVNGIARDTPSALTTSARSLNPALSVASTSWINVCAVSAGAMVELDAHQRAACLRLRDRGQGLLDVRELGGLAVDHDPGVGRADRDRVWCELDEARARHRRCIRRWNGEHLLEDHARAEVRLRDRTAELCDPLRRRRIADRLDTS